MAHTPNIPVDDQEFIDWAFDIALQRLEDGVPLHIDDVLQGRESLRAEVARVVRLAEEVVGGIGAYQGATSAPPTLRGYTILRALGSGGMGDVWLARQERLGGRAVALKVLPMGAGLSPRARQRFHNEANAIARVRHPNIVSVYDVIAEEGVHAFAMEWVDGASLQTIINTLARVEGDLHEDANPAQVERSQPGRTGTGRMATVADVLESESWPGLAPAYEIFIARIGLAIARALGEVHRAGLLHRDIKPSNILLRRNGTPLLSDFGLVREHDAAVTQVGHFAGTPAYASPAQLRGENNSLDARSDIFSLGATLYHALTLQRPFDGADSSAILKQIEQGVAVPMRRINPRVPRDLETVIAKAMDADAAKRYATADEFADDLERLLNLQPVRAKRAGVLTRCVKAARRNRRVLAGATLGGALALMLAAILVMYVFIVPKWVNEHVRAARIALLDPRHANLVFISTFFGQPVDNSREGNMIISPTAAGLALEHYDSALRWHPFDTGIRRERAVVANTLASAKSKHDPTKPASQQDAQQMTENDDRLMGLQAFVGGNVPVAIAHWSRFELDRDLAAPPDPFVEAALGILYLVSGEAARAYPRLRVACQAFPDVSFLTMYLADAAIQCGDLDHAERLLHLAESQSHVDPVGGLNRIRADLLAARGFTDEAETLYRGRDSSTVAAFNLAMLLRSQGRLVESLRVLEGIRLQIPAGRRSAEAFIAVADEWWQGLTVQQRAAAMTSTLKTPAARVDELDMLALLRQYLASVELTWRTGNGQGRSAETGRDPMSESDVPERGPRIAIRGRRASTDSSNSTISAFSAPLPGEDSSAYLQRASLWDIAHQMEVADMKLWYRIEQYPFILKVVQALAWMTPDPGKTCRWISKFAPVAAIAVISAANVNIAKGGDPCTAAPCFQGLGDLPGGAFASHGVGISADGTTVVGTSTSSNGTEAFRWRASTGMVGLGDLPGGGFFSIAYATSADGNTVVGGGLPPEYPHIFSHGGAFAWTEQDGMVPLGALNPSMYYSVAYSISDDGTVIGGTSVTDCASSGHGFRWLLGTGMTAIGNPRTTLFAMNADGSVLGGSVQSTCGSSSSQAFRWEVGVGGTELPDLPGGPEAFQRRVLDFTADGEVAVGVGNSASGFEAVLWPAGGTSVVGLGDLPGGLHESMAEAISPDGSLIVGVGTSTLGQEAVMWDGDGTNLRRVADELASKGVTIPTGWMLTIARDITIVGNEVVISGSGINPNGDTEAWIARYALGPPSPSGLSIQATGSCYQQGDQVVLHVNAEGLSVPATGGQFFLNFDHTKLAFVNATPGGVGNPANPFDLEVYECVGQTIGGACVPLPGRLDYAVGVEGGGPGSGTMADSTMAVLTFTALADVCNVADLVQFRDNVSGPLIPPTRLTDENGVPINLPLSDLGPIVIDTVPPVITCPSNISVNADAGLCSATVAIASATAVDACDASPNVVGTRSDAQPLSAPYPGGVTTITWTATDACGNFSQCTQTVTVSTFNEVVVAVGLQPMIANGTLTRCIAFDFWNGPGAPVFSTTANVTFNVIGGIATGTATVLVPCSVGTYDCMAARDPLHTLRRTDESFGIVGTQYVGDFTGDPASGGDWLIGGNLNDDEYIDILDFGVFVGRFGTIYGTGNTPCSTSPPHADINGDGLVNTLDYSFITFNFLKFREENCFGAPRLAGPITRISTRELARRGLRDLIRADLNGDGWLDTLDIDVFLAGGGGSSGGGGALNP